MRNRQPSVYLEIHQQLKLSISEFVEKSEITPQNEDCAIDDDRSN